ncbi:MurR/RpiR family transcriptional regulator [Paenibacillus sonchi]|uniref:MurR/RpiR family transcriptional regulator n=1 Tax=Paenibacillus sonchi TaxID=373687 RepID=A0A974PDJ2_9BACL|nr:MurR/RpiR family transcriptional regulator [Paenibacillus sonchi]QQZ61297.1 MurR/RpiR family transcriptional regulator [Paenibacillus sonchi]
MSNQANAVIAKIISNKGNLTFIENEIAQFVMNNPEFFTKNTITAIAQEVGVSETSINRFCKKVGFKGFNDFKIAIAQDTHYRNMNSKVQQRENISFADSLAFDYNDLIMNTSAMIEEEDISNAVKIIVKAKTIHIFGVLSSWMAALELKQKLSLVGINAFAYNDSYNMKLSASQSTPDDVVIAITRSGSVREIIDALNLASQNNAKIITITSYNSTAITEYSDIKLIASDKLSVKNNALLSEHITFLFVIDLIFGTLLKSDSRYMKKKLSSDAVIESSQFWKNEYI